MYPNLTATLLEDKQINEIDILKDNYLFEASSAYYACPGNDPKLITITCVPVDNSVKFGLRQPRVKLPNSQNQRATCILFSPYSPTSLFVGTSSGVCSIFNLPAKQLRADLMKPAATIDLKDEVKCAAYHPLVKDMVIIGLRSGVLKVFDKTLSAPLIELPHQRPLNSVAWSDDGLLVFALYADMTLKVWDVRKKETICETKVCASRALGFLQPLPGRRVLVSFSAGGKQELKIFDDKATSLASRQVGVNGTPLSITVHFTGLIVAQANRETKVYLLDSNNLQDVCVYTHTVGLVNATFDHIKPNPDGNVVIQLSLLNITNCLSRVQFTVPITPAKFPPWPVLETDLEPQTWLNGTDGQMKTEELVPSEKPQEVVVEQKKELGPQTFYKYLKCDPDPPRQYYIDLPVGQQPNPEFNEIACNGKEFAFIGASKTPQIYFLPIGKPIRFPAKCDSQIADPHGTGVGTMSYSPFNDRLFISGGDDCKAKLWTLPDQWVEPLRVPTVTLNHNRKVTIAKFSESCNNLLMTCTPQPEMYFWDLNTEKQIRNFSSIFGSDPIQDAVMSDMSSQAFAIIRDGTLFSLDPRQEKPEVTKVMAHPHGGRHRRLLYIPDFEYLASFGSSHRGERQLSIWDIKNLTKPIKTIDFDTASGSMLPMYEEGAGLIYLGGKGDGHIRYVELCHDDRIVASQGVYETSEPERGLFLLPRKYCDVMGCECSRMLKLATESLHTLHWRILRSHPEFFQDMIYPPVRDTSKPLFEVVDWAKGAVDTFPMFSFQPPNTKKYSEVMDQLRIKAAKQPSFAERMAAEESNKPVTVEDIVAAAPEISSEDESDESSSSEGW